MHFSTILAAVAAFGVSAVSAAPTSNAKRFVQSWDFFVAKGVNTITEKFPEAKVISIVGTTFDGQPTDTIMNIQYFDIRMEVGDDSWKTTNYVVAEDNTKKAISENGDFDTPVKTGRKPIGNTAFVFNKENVSVGGLDAQAALTAKEGKVTYTQVTLRNAQFPFGQNYFFSNEIDNKQYIVKAQVQKPAPHPEDDEDN